MGKFNSDWIERNVFYREAPGVNGVSRYVQFERPVIVCLCGSTRFGLAWQDANLAETLAGRIVLSIGCVTSSDTELQRQGKLTPEQKVMLDDLHRLKIDLADEVLVLNVPQAWCPKCRSYCDTLFERSRCCDAAAEHLGYVGESTRSEVKHAMRRGKTIRWLHPDAVPPDLDTRPKETAGGAQ